MEHNTQHFPWKQTLNFLLAFYIFLMMNNTECWISEVQIIDTLMCIKHGKTIFR